MSSTETSKSFSLRCCLKESLPMNEYMKKKMLYHSAENKRGGDASWYGVFAHFVSVWCIPVRELVKPCERVAHCGTAVVENYKAAVSP